MKPRSSVNVTADPPVARLPAPPPLRPLLICRWDLSPEDARRTQEALRGRLRSTPLRRSDLRYVAGCDCAAEGETLIGAAVVLRLPDLHVCDSAAASVPATFPYISGLLSFREIPVLLLALSRLSVHPQLLLGDAHGKAHPRRFGLASHLGVLLDLPAVGCAKSRLIGSHAPPGEERGSWRGLHEGRERIGAVLRTRTGVRPVYVSIGHRLTLADAIWVVLRCGGGYRVPEPIRRADQLVRELARGPGSPAVNRSPDAGVSVSRSLYKKKT